MSKRNPARAATLLLAGALLAAPAASFAQSSTPAASIQAASTQAKRRHAFVERRIEQLRTEIKITPGEQKSFDDFAATMRQNAAKMDEATEKGAALPASATAVDRLQTYSEMSQVHSQNMQQLAASFSAFYDTLSPEQKKVVDTSFAQQAAARHNARS